MRSYATPTAHPALSLPAAGLVSVGAAAAMFLAFPPFDWLGGWLVLPALAGLLWALRGQPAKRGAGLGLLAGLVFFGGLIRWVAVLGPDAWVALTLLCAVFWIPLGALLPRLLIGPFPVLAVPALWVGIEQLRAWVPWGGFPWGRLAFSQSNTVLGGWAVVIGAPGVSALVAAGAVVLVAVTDALAARDRPGAARRSRLVLAGLLGGVLIGLAGAGLPAAGLGGPVVATAPVAVVQGNVPRAGLDFNSQRRAVLDNHARATVGLAEQVRDGEVAAPRAVIWPENSSDIDPLRNADAAALISASAKAIAAPILVGTVITNPEDPYRTLDDGSVHPGTVLNVGLVWDPQTGPGQMYVKRHPVPFGEYLPLRGLLSRFISRFDRIPRDFAAGDVPGVLDLGGIPVGVVICFEVAYDNLPREVVQAGGQLLVVQTNNATYARTGQPEQQLAITRLRAIETGRDTLVAATSGISAAITPTGDSIWTAREFVSAAAVVEVGLRAGSTPAVRLGPILDLGAALAGLAAVGAWMAARRSSGGFGRRPAVAQSQGEQSQGD